MGQRAYVPMDAFEPDNSGFVRMLTSYNRDLNPTYIDEGNAEMFVMEQKSGEGENLRIDEIHLTPNQAFELRQKLDKFLELHFNSQRKPIVKQTGLLAKAASILPIALMAACKPT